MSIYNRNIRKRYTQRIIRAGIPALIMLALSLAAVIVFCAGVKKAFNAVDKDAFKTLVLDAGHGGIDSGAVSASGAKESDINLHITLKTACLANFCGVRTVLTRTDDANRTDISSYSEHEDLIFRAEKANSTSNAALISIHQNTYPTGQPCGAHVIYASDGLSEVWGKRTHNNLVSCLDPQNRRVPVPANGEVLLLSEARCPAILVECGFMSNFTEIEKLLDSDYQMKLAVIIMGSFLQNDFYSA